MPLVRAEGTILVFDKVEHHLYQNGGGGGGGRGGGTISAEGVQYLLADFTRREQNPLADSVQSTVCLGN